MKKLFIGFPLLILGLIACSSCTKTLKEAQDQSSPACSNSGCTRPVSPPASTDHVHIGTTWELSVPEGWVDNSPGPEGTELILVNRDKENMIILSKIESDSTPDQFTMPFVRSLEDIGATLVSVKNIDLNGKKFFLVEADRKGIKLWVWITTYNNFGYVLTCGGKVSAETANHDICFSVAKSLKLK